MRLTAWVLLLMLLPATALGSSDSDWEQHFSNGEGLEHEGRHVAAGREFEAALSVAEQLGPDNRRLPVTLHNLGTIARELGRYSESERYYQRAVSIWETHHPQRLTELAGTLQNLGALNMVWGRFSRAETFYRRAYELRLGALGPEHPEVGASLHGLAELAMFQHHYTQAEELYPQAGKILEAAYGADSLRIADVWHNWGFLYSQMRRDEEARSLLDRAAAIYDKNVPGHPNMAVILVNLAELDMRAGDLTQAGTRLERSVRICESSLPPDHEQTGIILEAYGRFLSLTKQKKEAKTMMEKSRAILAKGMKDTGAAYTIDISAFVGPPK
jgi:tetratricopeptide (TPR) repeat protein